MTRVTFCMRWRRLFATDVSINGYQREGTNMTDTTKPPRAGVSRRHVLKAAAGGAGVAIGSDAIRGFPTIWAQNLKDIKLLHVGQSYSAIKEIGIQASKDLGFTIEVQVVDANTQLNRLFTQPKTIDINDMELFDMIRLQGKKVLAPVPTAKYQAVRQDRADLHQG